MVPYILYQNRRSVNCGLRSDIRYGIFDIRRSADGPYRDIHVALIP